MARSKEIYPAWFGIGKDAWSATDKSWKWPNGSVLKLRHAENDDSYVDHQGHQYTWIGFDELPHWPNSTFYRQLKARLRSAHKVPNKRIRASGNPGGIGHNWIKQYFGIDRFPLGTTLLQPEIEGGATRMFIRSCVTDNKILLANDPGYIARLKDLGSPELVRAYLEGDWNVVAGAFYPEFSIVKHVIQPFEIPNGWVRFRAFDWGSLRPFCVLWFAVADGSTEHPRGAIIAYREWYGQKPGEPNIGLKMTAEEVADGILDREDEKIDMSVADPSVAKEDGGPSIMSRMAARKVFFQKADNSRKTGWDMLRSRLKGNGEKPMIYFFTHCSETIRTLPALQHDRGKAAGSIEDVDSDGEDHAGDTVRYACMARPWIRPGEPAQPPPASYDKGKIIQTSTTFNDLVQANRRRRLSRERGYE